MNYEERVNEKQAGADGTDIIEFYGPDALWPAITVKKLHETYRIGVGGVLRSRKGWQWAALCSDEFEGQGQQFPTKREALQYARELCR